MPTRRCTPGALWGTHTHTQTQVVAVTPPAARAAHAQGRGSATHNTPMVASVDRSMPLRLHTFTAPSSPAVASAEPSRFQRSAIKAAIADASTFFSSRPVLETMRKLPGDNASAATHAQARQGCNHCGRQVATTHHTHTYGHSGGNSYRRCTTPRTSQRSGCRRTETSGCS